jgi:GAF domain-containing protein
MVSDAKLHLEDLSSRQQALTDQLDPKRESKFLEFYVRLIPRVLNAERCSVFILDSVNDKIWLKAGTALRERGIEVPVENSIVGEVIRSGKPVITSDLQSRDGAHKTVDTTTGFVTREVICVPIHSLDGSKVTGAIQVLNRKGGGRFTEDDQSFLVEVGEHFESIVESIYVGQEAVSMTRSAVATASRATILSFMAIFVCIFAITTIQLYGSMQPWFTDKPKSHQYMPPDSIVEGKSISR